MPAFPALSVKPSYSLDTAADFPTDVVWYGEMDEQRLMRRTTAKRTWKMKYRLMSKADLDLIWAFFASVKGKADAFDWTEPDTGEQVTVHFAEDTIEAEQVTQTRWRIAALTLVEV